VARIGLYARLCLLLFSACGFVTSIYLAVNDVADLTGATLVALSFLALVLALRGAWPLKVSSGGNSAEWIIQDEVRGAISSIEQAADGAGEDINAHRALVDALDRLEYVMKWVGPFSQRLEFNADRHPAAEYDLSLAQELNGMDGIVLKPSSAWSRDRPDFVAFVGKSKVYIESKFTSDYRFRGSTLLWLLDGLAREDRLRVVTNATEIEEASRRVETFFGKRGAVVSWRGKQDSAHLERALRDLAMR
jgi:hypothetical protein